MCLFCLPQYLLGCVQVVLVDGRETRRVYQLSGSYPTYGESGRGLNMSGDNHYQI